MKPPSAWSPGTRDRRGGTDNGLIRRPGGSTRPDDGRHDGTATRPSRELGGKPKCALDPSSASAIGLALLRLDKDHCQDSPLLPFSSRDCPESRDCHASAAMYQIMHCPKPRIHWSQFLSSDGHRRRVANRICGPAASGAVQASPLSKQIFRVPPCREASVRTRPPVCGGADRFSMVRSGLADARKDFVAYYWAVRAIFVPTVRTGRGMLTPPMWGEFGGPGLSVRLVVAPEGHGEVIERSSGPQFQYRP